MVLAIDSSRAFRYPSELAMLVKAVLEADATDESHWIEWKCGALDLSSKDSEFKISKQVLGFANRDPSKAAKWAEGHAYLLIGVEPGSLTGVQPIDHEKLSSNLRAYIDARVNWHPEFVSVEGRSVFVIIVEPPRAGDPIFTLKKAWENHHQGKVFTRRPGATDAADVAEMQMLERRLIASSSSLELDLSSAPTIEQIPPAIEFIDEWCAEERERLLARGRYKPPPGQDQRSDYPGALIFEGIRNGDTRTGAKYREQIDAYIKKCRHALAKKAVDVIAIQQLAVVRLVLHNRTPRNFQGVRVVIHMPSKEIKLFKAKKPMYASNEGPRLPLPPPPLGTPRIPEMYLPKNLGFPRAFPLPRLDWGHNPGYEANDGGSITVTYDAVDLRPHDDLSLPVVPITVTEKQGVAMEIEWEATCTNTDGKVSGTTSTTVVASTLDLDKIVPFNEVG